MLVSLAVFCCVLIMLTPTKGCASGKASETELRALFIYHFTGFVTWPATAARSADQPLRICVKDNEIAPILERVAKGESVNGKPIVIVHPVDSKRWGECHMYYFATPELTAPTAQDFLRKITKAGILSISDNDTFVYKGGMVSLVRDKGRIHPLINTDEVSRGQIKISPKLLKLSTTLTDSK